MITLTTMKFDSSCTMHEHVIEMTNIVAKLKSLGMTVDEGFLVQFILNSLPYEYGSFQMNYNTMKDKWNVHELHNMLVQEVTRLKNIGRHSIHMWSIKEMLERKLLRNMEGVQGHWRLTSLQPKSKRKMTNVIFAGIWTFLEGLHKA